MIDQKSEEQGVPHLGPLTPEGPLGGPAPVTFSSDRLTTSRSQDKSGGGPASRSGEYRGTVLNVIQPVINVNPWLVLDMRTESGATVAVRARFFWGLIRAPYIAEGHYVSITGRMSRAGYVKPARIVNETTGSKWQRRLP